MIHSEVAQAEIMSRVVKTQHVKAMTFIGLVTVIVSIVVFILLPLEG
jgi:hypothetical protein